MKYLGNLVSVLIGFFLMSFILGCDSGEECCVIVDVDVQILYKNNLGKNLINSNGDFNESNIKVYYKNGDEFEYIFRGNLDNPGMYDLNKDEEDNLILTVFPSNYYEGNQSTTLIELNENVIDTLVCEFELDSGREICKRAWLNGVELNNRFIEIMR